MRQRFEELITGLCALKELGDPYPFIHGSAINVNGIMCTLIYDEHINPELLYVHVAFDYAPHEQEALIYKVLLQQNHVGFEGRGPGFCISPTTGKVGYMIGLAVERTAPNQLASLLAYYADKAIEWKQTYFLDKAV